MERLTPSRPQTTSFPPAVPGYDLKPPVEEDLLRSLRRLLGPDADHAWTAACSRARVTRSPSMPSSQVALAAQELVSHGGLIEIHARSIIIRANVYSALTHTQP